MAFPLSTQRHVKRLSLQKGKLMRFQTNLKFTLMPHQKVTDCVNLYHHSEWEDDASLMESSTKPLKHVHARNKSRVDLRFENH